MLPPAYGAPFAIVLVLGGTLACFAGYRLFRIVLAVYGFIAGAMLASSVMGISNSVGMVVAALLGGIAGALILVFAYFVGIALVGAGLGAMIVHVFWARVSAADPPAVLIIVFLLLGAVAAMLLQRYVIIVSTAFGGAWTLLVGALALAGGRASPARGVAVSEVWILYPTTPAPGARWLPFAWIVLGLVGTAIQLGITGRKR